MFVNYALNAIGLVLLLLILENSIKTLDISKPKTKVFYTMILLTILQILLYSTTNYLNDNKYFEVYYLASIFNSLLYIVNCIFEIFFILYLLLKLERNNIKKRILYISIPSVIVMILSIINFFTPVFFVVSSDYTIERTNLDYISRIIPFLYFTYGVILSLSSKRNEKKYITIPVIVFLIPVIIAVILEVILKNYSLLPVAFATGLASLYMNILKQASTIDILSGLYNRVQLTNTIESLVNRKNKNDYVSGIIFDIDHFKQINDIHGHIIGDEIIKELGAIIIKSLKGDSYGYRYGGDEFVIIDRTSSLSDINDIINNINKNIDEFNQRSSYDFTLSLSFGYTKLENNDTFNSFISKMDKNMYSVKKMKKM